MKKQDAIQHFGGARYLAAAINVSVQAVHKWGESVPAGRVDQISALMQSKPPVDQSAQSLPDHP